MKIVADLHTHTTLSGHAFSTLYENIQVARKKKLKVLALTDHGPAMQGASSAPYLFVNQFVIGDYVQQIRILKGAEVNILGEKGAFDIPDFILQSLDWVLASLHEVTIGPSDAATNLRRFEDAMATGMVDAIAHPGNPAFPVDFEALAQRAKHYGVALELNNTSLRGLVRKGSKENIRAMLSSCKKHQVWVCLGSDAHWMEDVGDTRLSQALLKEMDFPKEWVLNQDEARLNAFVNTRKELRAKRQIRKAVQGGYDD